MIYETYSEEETKKIGYEIAKKAKEGEVYCLEGDLGVGKTVFTKGFAEGLEITEHITSPTFTIVNEYTGKYKFNHFDVYRIESSEEMEEIGFDEYIYSDAITLIEWPSLISDILPSECINITIKKDLSKGLDYRKIEILK
ncbi:MAG: tRNA (adenosine(37)-N6)-threonylcarbamoyltransferase complex ATPase subunit type 1 TsaE [Clostridia bacterium]|jgi:tRNA threonylcarbamoyladenosine biosynthesis protein TsaE|nr:tRNA (adenosine(37)-N6)-threonylcarbamoyltransferase complex ATPase subunit type 1 TsaE [Clostridia bacterium]